MSKARIKTLKAAFGSKKILIIEDNYSIARVLAKILETFGTASFASSGAEAIELLRKEDFDLILTDYEMEDGNGIDVLEYLAASANPTPTIMITAFGTKELILRTMRFHIFGFIEKPFERAAVETLVQDAICFKEEDEKLRKLVQLGSVAGELLHEISNPLTVIEYHVQKTDQKGADSRRKLLIKETDKLKKILQTARRNLQSGNTSEAVHFLLEEAVIEAKNEFILRSQNKAVTVNLEGNFKQDLFGDPDQLRQIIVNLVNNAIDAASLLTEKWVKVSADSSADEVILRVTDSGMGIPDSMRLRLFQPLFSTKGKHGTGLGLTIVRRIAKEHGGTVSLNEESQHTEFVLTLPVPSRSALPIA